MRVLAACSLGGLGHLRPLLEVGDALVAAGHDVHVVAPGPLAGVAAARGYDVTEGAEPAAELLEALRERVVGPDARAAAIAGNRDLFGRAAARALAPAVADAFGAWRPDVVVRETCEYASAALARRRGVAVVQVAIGLARIEWASLDLAEPALEELAPGLTAACRATPYVTGLPAPADPSPFPRTRRYGRRADPRAEPLPDWWPGDLRPLCYLTLGSVAPRLEGAAAAWSALLEGLGGLNVRVLATLGEALEVGPVADGVHVERFVDQDRVLAAADVVVSHGGAGTVMGALVHGVPQVVVPVLADNAANGRLVASLDAGVALERPRGLPRAGDVPAIIEAVDRVLFDPGFADAAHDAARSIAAAPTLGAVLEDVLAAGGRGGGPAGLL